MILTYRRQGRRSFQRGLLRIGLPLLLASFSLVLAGPGAGQECPEWMNVQRQGSIGEPESLVSSFLVVGDFGQPPRGLSLFDPRSAVAEAMDEAHRCRPSHAMIQLGDNFYPRGLTEENFERRIRDTVVRPFCRFLSLSGEHGQRLASDCRVEASARIPVPIVGVMGNHDYEPPVNGALAFDQLSHWIPEWKTPRGLAQVFEMPGGVSLIALDSVRLHEGADFEELSKALASAKGPWVVLLAHHPLTVGGRPWEERYADGVFETIKTAGRTVHMMLAGHEHYLATSLIAGRGIPLQVVVGSGARVRDAAHTLHGTTERFAELGYMRFDVVSPRDSEPFLELTLVGTRPFPFSLWSPTRPLIRLGISPSGALRRLTPESVAPRIQPDFQEDVTDSIGYQ